ncbi:uncharacterized protein MICPUCDRAFT_31058, partial [Micromonas pusilla CCMP1545]
MARLARGLQRKRELRLKDVSPALAALKGRVTHTPMPGTELDASAVAVVSVRERVTTLPTKTRPKRVVLLGSDGVERAFLLKGHEDLRLDERAMRALRAVNATLANDADARRRRLCAREYSVTPLVGYGGLIQWVERATPLSAMFGGWQRRTRAANALPPPGAPEEGNAGLPSTASRRHWPKTALRETLRVLSSEVPIDLLRRELWSNAPCVASTTSKTTAHARSVAVASVFGHLIGLGDRHLDNVLVDLATGDVVHIDYNVAFDRGLTLPVPERVPFRLTPSMVHALGPFGTRGPFQVAMEITLRALRERRGREVLLGSLEAFARDPLSEWTEEGGGIARNTHLKQRDAANEHKSLEAAAGLTLFASRARGEMKAGLDAAAEVMRGLDVDADVAVVTVGVAASDAAAFASAAAAATAAAEDAFRAAAAAAAASDAASDAEEFSHQAAATARASVAAASAAIADATADAAARADKHASVLARLAAGAELAVLRETRTPPLPLPLPEALPLPHELRAAVADADAEGARVLIDRDRAVARATEALTAYASFLERRLPPSYARTDRRRAWADALST